jgi:hypothetical protein
MSTVPNETLYKREKNPNARKFKMLAFYYNDMYLGNGIHLIHLIFNLRAE